MNINFIKFHKDSLREILHESPWEEIFVDETKLDESFSNEQFKIKGFNVHHLGGIGINMVVGRLFLLKMAW